VSEPGFSGRLLQRFVQTAAVELGADQINTMLTLANLPGDLDRPERFRDLDARNAAETYASLQTAMRTYYGRGARGVLLRVGQRMWHHLLEDAALTSKAQAAVIRRLPLTARRKQTLELLARLLSVRPGDVTVHTLDLDLLLADHASPSAHGQTEKSPICFVTQGLIRECLYWATDQRHDVEETSCKARGEIACEFKITLGN
jgi:predicted hydrocarbon binding protein